MTNFWLALGVAGTILQVVVIYLMTKGFYRRYPWVFLYLLILFLTSVGDFAAWLDPDSWNTWYMTVFYTNNAIRQFSGFFAVVSLYLIATSTSTASGSRRFFVVFGALSLMVLTFAWSYESGIEAWAYSVQIGRDMSFITAVLILVLWFALVRTRVGDRLLFLVSSGLGLNMAGEAIGQSLHVISEAQLMHHVADGIGVGSHLICLLIWIKALRLDVHAAGVPSSAATQ